MSSISTPSANQRLNVLEVIGNAIVGGMENYVARLIERLPPERFNVAAVCPFESPFTDLLRSRGVDVVVTSMPDDPPWSSVHMGCALVKTHAIDVLHAHLPNAHVLAGLIGKVTGKPVLATIHGRQLSTLDVEVHRTAGTHLSVVCRHTYFQALGLGVNPGQLHCIANGVDVERFRPRRLSPSPLRGQWKVPDDAPVVGFVGRLSPEKGPDLFLKAAVQIHQSVPQAHFVMAGEGPMLAQLRQFVKQFEMNDYVHLVGVHQDMPAVFNEMDIVVSSSHSEAMPFAIMEAMACGVPVVATRVGGVPDLIQHGRTGWLVDPMDYDEIAKQVVTLLMSRQECKAMGEHARQRAVERFSMEVSAHATMELLTRLGPTRSEQRRVSALVSTAKLNGAPRAAAASAAASGAGKAASA